MRAATPYHLHGKAVSGEKRAERRWKPSKTGNATTYERGEIAISMSHKITRSRPPNRRPGFHGHKCDHNQKTPRIRPADALDSRAWAVAPSRRRDIMLRQIQSTGPGPDRETPHAYAPGGTASSQGGRGHWSRCQLTHVHGIPPLVGTREGVGKGTPSFGLW